MAGAEKGRGVPAGKRKRVPAAGANTRETPRGSAAREAAIRRLDRVESEGAFVARLAGDLSPADARLASDLVAGVTRLRRRLDYLLAPHVRGGLSRLDSPVRQALRIGAYDLVERGTPAHAAVGEAVEAASRVSHRGGAALVNAVLRSVARSLEKGPPSRPDTGDPAEDLATWHSYPSWLVHRWLDRMGPDETEAVLAAGNVAPAFGLRANPRKLTGEQLAQRLTELGVEFRESRWVRGLLVVHRLQPILSDGMTRHGLVSVQDEAAALVVSVLDPRPDEAILDAAAAPGGKTLLIAERMDSRGRLVALDVHAGKLGLLERAAVAHDAGRIETVAADLREVAGRQELSEAFDRVLLDAPCSGLGVLARRADLRWNRGLEDLERLVVLQDELLDAAAAAVRPGGLLVYATCSIEPVENEHRVEAFLLRRSDFRREAVGSAVPPEMRTQLGDYAALPHIHGTDGAYAARLRRS